MAGILGGPGEGAPRLPPPATGEVSWLLGSKGLRSPDRCLEPGLGSTPPTSPCTVSAPLHPRFSTAHQSARPSHPLNSAAGAATATASHLVSATPIRHLGHAQQAISSGVGARPLPLASQHYPLHHLSWGQSALQAGRASAPPNQPLGHAHLAQQVSSPCPRLL